MVTDPSNATCTKEYNTQYGYYGSSNDISVRIYRCGSWSLNDLKAEHDNIVELCDDIINNTPKLNGYRVRSFDTNLDHFYDSLSLCDAFNKADDYVDAFDEQNYIVHSGGGNMWLDRDGGTFGIVDNNHPVWPKGYGTSNQSYCDQDYPHSFKIHDEDNYDPELDINFSYGFVHEFYHQMLTPSDAWSNDYPNSSRSHDLAHADKANGTEYTTLMSRPSSDGWYNGDCYSSTQASPTNHSMTGSPCEYGAIAEAVEYAIDNY